MSLWMLCAGLGALLAVGTLVLLVVVAVRDLPDMIDKDGDW